MPSEHFLDQAQADNATDPFLLLLTIDHPDLPDEVRPMRFVRDFVPCTSRGATFQPFPFDFARPAQGEQRQAARIIIDNVDQRIVQTIRALASPPTLLIEMIVASLPDEVEETLPLFKLYAVSGDRTQLEAELVDTDDDNEPLTRWTFTPSLAPALFA